MAEDRLKIWETLFQRALELIDSVSYAGITLDEIVAKKVWHRGVGFTARDIFDLAMVTEREPNALRKIESVLHDRRDTILQRIASQDAFLRDAFAELDVLDYRRNFDECIGLVKKALG
jgi:hypothetical protein